MIAANAYQRFFPMLMTAAGTVKAARVLILGAGVAGLQAIATARRLGAVVTAFDVRAADGDAREVELAGLARRALARVAAVAVSGLARRVGGRTEPGPGPRWLRVGVPTDLSVPARRANGHRPAPHCHRRRAGCPAG